jgi:hypothetical protein
MVLIKLVEFGIILIELRERGDRDNLEITLKIITLKKLVMSNLFLAHPYA